MRKKILNAILVSCIWLVFGLNVYAEDNPVVHEIATADDLFAFAELVNSGDYDANAILTADIVLNEHVLDANGKLVADVSGLTLWTGIGPDANPYTGVFDGDGHKIYGIYAGDTAQMYVGLFRGISSGGVVKNVGIEDSYFTGDIYIGSIVGYNHGGEILNCYNNGLVDGHHTVGGIVGINAGKVSECYNLRNVNAYDLKAGGIAGYNNQNGVISKCYNMGQVKSTLDVGGIVGYQQYGDTNNCYNTGKIIGEGSYNSFTSNFHIGGIIGELKNGSVSDCHNMGAVRSANSSRVGGIVGSNAGQNSISNCYYLTGCAVDGGGTIQNGIGGFSLGAVINDSLGRTFSKSEAEMASGEVAYLLNGSTSGDDTVWRQAIGTDLYPVFAGKKVYGCNGYGNEDHEIEYYEEEASIVASCSKCEADFGAITLLVEGKVYDGTTLVAEAVYEDWKQEYKGNPTITYAYSVSESGAYEAVTTPLNAGYYKATLHFWTEEEQELNVNKYFVIKPVVLEIQMDTNDVSKRYDGTTDVVGTLPTLNIIGAVEGETPVLDTENAVYQYDTKAAGENKRILASGIILADRNSYPVNANYVLSDIVGIGAVILPKTVLVTAEDKEATVGESIPEFTYTVSGLIEGDKLTVEPEFSCEADGDVAGDYEIVISGAEQNSGNYIFEYVNGILRLLTGDTVEEHEIVYEVVEDSIVASCSKCETCFGTITLVIENKTYDGNILAAETVYESWELEYRGNPTVTYTYSVSADGEYETITTPVNAGYYKATLHFLTEEEREITVTKPFVIRPKNVVITAEDKEVIVGEGIPEFTYTVSGLIGDDRLTVEPEISCEVDVEVAGDYEIAISGAQQNSGNYSIEYVNGTLRLLPNDKDELDENPFADIKETDWYYPYAKYVYENGLMVGKDVDEAGKVFFAPLDPMSRAEFVQVLYSKEGKQEVTYEDCFSDVKESDWFADAVIWAKQMNIVAGNGTSFNPYSPITRQEMIAILYTYATTKSYESKSEKDISSYADYMKISVWAVNSVRWAVSNDVVAGTGDNKLNPLNSVTRAEAATIIKAFITAFEKE